MLQVWKFSIPDTEAYRHGLETWSGHLFLNPPWKVLGGQAIRESILLVFFVYLHGKVGRIGNSWKHWLVCLQRQPPLCPPLLLHDLLVPGHRHGHCLLPGLQVLPSSHFHTLPHPVQDLQIWPIDDVWCKRCKCSILLCIYVTYMWMHEHIWRYARPRCRSAVKQKTSMAMATVNLPTVNGYARWAPSNFPNVEIFWSRLKSCDPRSLSASCRGDGGQVKGQLVKFKLQPLVVPVAWGELFTQVVSKPHSYPSSINPPRKSLNVTYQRQIKPDPQNVCVPFPTLVCIFSVAQHWHSNCVDSFLKSQGRRDQVKEFLAGRYVVCTRKHRKSAKLPWHHILSSLSGKYWF